MAYGYPRSTGYAVPSQGVGGERGRSGGGGWSGVGAWPCAVSRTGAPRRDRWAPPQGRRNGSTAPGPDHHAVRRAPPRDESVALRVARRYGFWAPLLERRSERRAPLTRGASTAPVADQRSRYCTASRGRNIAQRGAPHRPQSTAHKQHRKQHQAGAPLTEWSGGRDMGATWPGALTWLPPARRPGEESQVGSPIEHRSPLRTARRLRAGKLGSAVTLQSTALFTGRRSLVEGRLEAEARSESRSESTVLKGGRCSQSYGEQTGTRAPLSSQSAAHGRHGAFVRRALLSHSPHQHRPPARH
ncbi:hypothetical protein H181DRAFT_03243 [Streptomyces sp. WMMB 714]|nr:hypothetical protein H181DRAFT_03243 [Streptomyces sp. WMMB 714]